MTSTTAKPTRPLPASFRKRYDALMAFNECGATVAARERNKRAWVKLEQDLKAKGYEMADLW